MVLDNPLSILNITLNKILGEVMWTVSMMKPLIKGLNVKTSGSQFGFGRVLMKKKKYLKILIKSWRCIKLQRIMD